MSKLPITSAPRLKFLCKPPRIFFRVYKFGNRVAADYAKYSELVQSEKQTEIFAQRFSA